MKDATEKKNKVFFGIEEGKEEKKEPHENSCCPAVYVSYYKEYFDISTVTAFRRMARAVWPLFPQSFVEAEGKADLYVPVWTYFTLMVTMSSLGTIVEGIDAISKDTTKTLSFSFDTGLISYYAAIFSFYFFINPAIFCLFLKCKGSKIGFAHMLCIVGYSFVPFIPLPYLFLINSEIFKVSVLIGAACLAMHFLYRNLGELCDKYLIGYTYCVRAYMIMIEIALIFLIYTKFYPSS